MRLPTIHLGPRHDTYWWGGSIGMDVKGGWCPLWYVEWGGKGYKRYGAPLFSCLIPVWRWKIRLKTP